MPERARGALSKYHEKRAFTSTPEPVSAQSVARHGPLGFVVQLHRARREHFDFRLELDGVLKSWAVPNGLPTEPGQKRLAVATEDHPLEYASFEGVIPKGAYGAGAVIVWDCGVYGPTALGADGFSDRRAAEAELRTALAAGQLKFTLRGVKSKGSYALIRTADCWLVIRHADPRPRLVAAPSAQSVLSGVTVADAARTADQRVLPFPEGTPESFPLDLAPMLAQSGGAPITRAGWCYEPKLDGYRMLAFVAEGRVRLRTRNGHDLAPAFPAIAAELAEQAVDLVLDGELVALAADGRPSFAALQRRAPLRGGVDPTAERETPVAYVVFDVLHAAGLNVRATPYRARRRTLEQLLLPTEGVQIVASHTHAESLYEASLALGHEGIVAKRCDSGYLAGRRSDAWLKIKPQPTAEFAIAGYTRTERGIGALLLGEWQDERLVYVGSVGTGLERAGGAETLQHRLDRIQSRKAAFPRPPNIRRPITWVCPETIAEVSFRERTAGGRLRQPVFERLRDDLPRAGTAAPDTPTSEVGDALAQLDGLGETGTLAVGSAQIPLTHLGRVYWPASDRSAPVTKRDYLRYLVRVSPLMLPHLAHRPVTAIRFPGGIGGERFFQKHWHTELPEFVAEVSVWSASREGSGRYLLCNNLPTLLWMAQQGSLEFHVWHSRAWRSADASSNSQDYARSLAALEGSLLDLPDYLVFDLDPYLYAGDEAAGEEPRYHAKGFAQVRRVAFALRDVLLAMGFTPRVKLSGKTGVHVFVFIERTLGFDAVRDFVADTGRHLMALLPRDVTMEWNVAKRTGKVFFDHNMNVRGKTLPVAYSPRAAAGAPISWPITWDQLEHVEPADFRIGTARSMVARGDAWATATTDTQNVQRTLGLQED